MSTAVTLDPDKAYEIVDGHPEEKAMVGARHGRVVMRLGARLEMYVEQQHLGGIYSPNTTFQIGRNQRLPDLAFVAAARLDLVSPVLTSSLCLSRHVIPEDADVTDFDLNDVARHHIPVGPLSAHPQHVTRV